MQTEKKCKRPGCNKKYKQSQNNGTACRFHPGKPIFHDCKKGWTCCQVTVYEWSQFQKIQGCATGEHSDQKLDTTSFFKSQTVNNAQKGIDKAQGVKIRTAADYNQQMERKKKQQQDKKKQLGIQQKKEPKKNKQGRFVCGNLGCSKKSFLDQQNGDQACSYHKGAPVFHDLVKYWSCCKDKQCWDWDQFLKIPTCAVGRHKYKYK